MSTVAHAPSESGGPERLSPASGWYWVFFTLFTALCIVWLVLATWTLRDPAPLPHSNVVAMHMQGDGSQHFQDLVFSVGTLALGVWVVWTDPDEITRRWFAIGLVGTSVGFSLTAHHLLDAFGGAAPGTPLSLVHLVFHVVAGVAYTGALVLFPDGRVPRASPTNVAVGTGLAVVLLAMVYLGHQPAYFLWYCGLATVVAGFGCQLYKAKTYQGEDARVSSTFAGAFLFMLMCAGAIEVIEWETPLRGLLGVDQLASVSHQYEALTIALIVLPPFLFATTLVVAVGTVSYPKLKVRSVAFHRRRLILHVLLVLMMGSYVLVEFGIHRLLDRLGPDGWLQLGGPIAIAIVIGLGIERVRDSLADGCRLLLFGTETDPRRGFSEMMDLSHGRDASSIIRDLAAVCRESVGASKGWLVVAPGEDASTTYAWPDVEAQPPCRIPLGLDGRADVLYLGRDDGKILGHREQALAADLARHAAVALRRLREGPDPGLPTVVVVHEDAAASHPSPGRGVGA